MLSASPGASPACCSWFKCFDASKIQNLVEMTADDMTQVFDAVLDCGNTSSQLQDVTLMNTTKTENVSGTSRRRAPKDHGRIWDKTFFWRFDWTHQHARCARARERGRRQPFHEPLHVERGLVHVAAPASSCYRTWTSVFFDNAVQCKGSADKKKLRIKWSNARNNDTKKQFILWSKSLK